MNKKFITCFTFALTILTSCAGDIKSTLGIRKEAPDEFMVISNPPLKEPPEFTLEQPKTKGSNMFLNDEFERGIIRNENVNNLSLNEKNFLNQLDTSESSSIKIMIDEEQNNQSVKYQSQGTARRTLSKLKGSSNDPVINPASERDRIKKNILDNKPINEGNIEEKSRSTLSRLFD